jgi:hypothetical protein
METCAYEKCPDVAKNTVFKTCGACHIARYCSVVCQRAAWPAHKLDCKKVDVCEAVDCGRPATSEWMCVRCAACSFCSVECCRTSAHDCYDADAYATDVRAAIYAWLANADNFATLATIRVVLQKLFTHRATVAIFVVDVARNGRVVPNSAMLADVLGFRTGADAIAYVHLADPGDECACECDLVEVPEDDDSHLIITSADGRVHTHVADTPDPTDAPVSTLAFLFAMSHAHARARTLRVAQNHEQVVAYVVRLLAYFWTNVVDVVTDAADDVLRKRIDKRRVHMEEANAKYLAIDTTTSSFSM